MGIYIPEVALNSQTLDGKREQIESFVGVFLPIVGDFRCSLATGEVKIQSENERRWLIGSGVNVVSLLRAQGSGFSLRSRTHLTQLYIDLEGQDESSGGIPKVRLRKSEPYVNGQLQGSVIEMSCKLNEPQRGSQEYAIELENDNVFDMADSLGLFDTIVKDRYIFEDGAGNKIIVDLLEYPYRLGFVEIEYPTKEALDVSETLEIIRNLEERKKMVEVTGLKPLSNRNIARFRYHQKIGKIKGQDWFETQVANQLIEASIKKVFKSVLQRIGIRSNL